jgi:hypothetical protein
MLNNNLCKIKQIFAQLFLKVDYIFYYKMNLKISYKINYYTHGK